jgi:vitamin B12 transporter
MFRILLPLFCLLLPLTAKAELEITIYAFRTSNDLAFKTYSYDVVTPDKIKSIPSLNLVQSGPEGQMTSTFLRGTNSNHTLITLNGIAIKDHSTPGGTDDISQHSFLGVERVEVIKGPMGSVYGPNSIGGTINMVTQPNEENSVSVSTGSNNTNTQTIKLGKFYNNTLVDVRIENETSDGISVVDGNEDDNYTNRNYIIQTETYNAIPDYTLKTSLIETNNKTNLDKSTDYTNYTADWQFNNYYMSLQNKDEEYTINHTKHDRVYDDKGTVDTYKNDTTTLLAKKTIHQDNNSHTLGTEYEYNDIEFDTNIAGYDSNVTKNRTNNGYFYRLDQTTLADVQMHYGIRLDTPNTFDDQLTYRIGAEKNGVRLSYATGYKAPTVYEMYGKNNYGFLGNKDLIPEKSKTYELGYRWESGDIVFFKTEIDNLLTYDSNTYINDTKKSDRHGVELGLTSKVGDVNIQNNTAFIIAEDGNGTEIVRKPKWTNTTNFNLNNWNLDVNYYGSHLDIDNTTYAKIKMESVTTADLFYKVDKGGLTIYGKLSNITDEDYERPDGYNQLGRSFNIGLKKTF